MALSGLRVISPLAVGERRLPLFGNTLRSSALPSHGEPNPPVNGRACGPSVGQVAATLLSLVQSCRSCGVNPREYLEDVMQRLLDHPANALRDLLPHRWVKR